jgi:hypothetical protein
VRHREKRRELPEEFRELPDHGSVLPVVLGLVGIGVVVCAMWALEPAKGGPGERLASCVSIGDDHQRLACYDQIAALHQPAINFSARDRNE